MRQIKFRGKDRKTGKWVYGNLLNPFTGSRIVNYTEIDKGSVKQANYHYYDVYEDSVGQFTGLHDINGKEIYEGDMVESCFKYEGLGPNGGVSPDQDCIIRGVVEWEDFGLCIKLTYCDYPLKSDFKRGDLKYVLFTAFESPADDIEIIGNIHDNPELLKSE